MRATRAAASLAALIALVVVAGLGAVQPSQAATSTRVALKVVSSQPAPVGSRVTFTATITPSTAAGTVAFTIDERPLATVSVSRGSASTSVRVPRAGQYLVRAAFTPAPGTAGVSAASSSSVVLVVGSVARISLQTSAGRPIPEGTPVPAGTAIRIAAAGFPARSTLSFTLGAASLPGTLTTDSRGSGTFSSRVPGLEKGDYLVVAYGGKSSAIATIAVEGVVPGATPTPTFCPVSSPPPTDPASPTPTKTSPKPTSTSPKPTKSSRPPTDGGKPTSTRPSTSRSDDDGDDGDGEEGRPGGGGDLPRTGAAVLSLLLLAGLAFAFGTGLISLGRRPSGRHSR